MALGGNNLLSSLTKRMRFAGETSLFETAGKRCTVVQAFHPSNILKNRNASSQTDLSDKRKRVHQAALLDLSFIRAINATQGTEIVGDGISKLRKMALGVD